MITKTIIEVLRNDSTIQSLLDATGASDCPVFVNYNFDDTLNKQINVSMDYGETVPFEQTDRKTHDGRCRVFIMIKDTVSEPVEKIDAIAVRIHELLDLKGTDLDTNSTVFWLQKLDTDFNHYDELHMYELAITYRFVIKEA